VKRIFLATALALPLAGPTISFAATGTSGSGAAPTATSTNCTAASKQSDVRGTQAQGVLPTAARGGNGGPSTQEVRRAAGGGGATGKQVASAPLTPCG
jgi:hypothetical protein